MIERPNLARALARARAAFSPHDPERFVAALQRAARHLGPDEAVLAAMTEDGELLLIEPYSLSDDDATWELVERARTAARVRGAPAVGLFVVRYDGATMCIEVRG